MLVQDPQNLVRMRNQVRGKLQADEPIHRRARSFRNVEQPAGEHVIENLFGRIPLERDCDDLRFVSKPAQRVAQSFGVDLGAAANERDLRGRDQDPHGATFRPTIA